jgi:glycosyltransferase involved in cell wall biosynthesis
MQRLKADVFLRHPDYAWSIWKTYNERLLAFQRRHRDRCLLINIESLVHRLEQFPSLLHERLGLPIRSVNLNDHFQPKLMGTARSGAYGEEISRAVWPNCFQLYDQLESESDLPAGNASMADEVQRKVRLPADPPAAPAASSTYTMKDLSIVIPTYNDAVLLVEAITSVERTTQGQAELLICDDDSKDPASIQVLDRLREAGYRVQRHSNRGLSATRNRLISEARGKLILPLDADNRLSPGFIENAIAAFNRDPQLGVVYGNRRLFGLVDCDLPVAEFHLHRIAWRNYIDACAMFRRELWEDVDGYDESLWALEDWEFWIHAGKKGWRFQHLPQIALEYRVRPNSLLARVNTRSHYRKLNRLVMTKHFDLYSSLVPKVVREVLPNQFGRTDDGAKRNISTLVLWITTVFLGIRYSILRLTRK